MDSPWKELWVRNGICRVGTWPIVVAKQSIGGIILGRREGDFTDDAEIVSLCAGQLSLILEMLSTRRQVEYVSNHDPLTNIFNRRGFIENINEFLHGETGASRFIVGILDVNNFKHLNDTFGHRHGDSVLINIADELKVRIGKDGICARFGGDEFVFVIKASMHATAMEKHVESWFFNKPYSVTVGCADMSDDWHDWENDFKEADEHLYLNKDQKIYFR